MPDPLKGHKPCAFITLSTFPHPTTVIPDAALISEIQNLVREQIGAISSLSSILQGQNIIPKTRSGKTLRRVLRHLAENAVKGEFDMAVDVPATVEDMEAVENARMKLKEYVTLEGSRKITATSKSRL